MIHEGPPPTPLADDDPKLAALSEEITRRLERGETVDPDEYQEAYPELSAPVRGLIPMLNTLVELGREIGIGPGGHGPDNNESCA